MNETRLQIFNQALSSPETQKEFQEAVKKMEAAIKTAHDNATKKPTPEPYISSFETKPDWQYVEYGDAEAMRDEAFPIHYDEWHGPGIQFLGSEWVIATVLTWVMVGGQWRCEPGVEAKRITFKKDSPHTAENIIDVGNDVKSTTSLALVNGWSRHGLWPDVYRKKHVELPTEEQSKRFESLIVDIAPELQIKLRKRWETNNRETANAFLDNLEKAKQPKEPIMTASNRQP